MNEMKEYSDNDLERLHSELLDILNEIVRICDILKIKFIVTGGTAIGTYYFQGFVKWDDDIDIGMLREDYTLFEKEAPRLVSKGFFIQCLETEPTTPFYCLKVRKDNTLFIQEPYQNLAIHHGIFVDVFPFDKVPDNKIIARIHQRAVQYFEGLFRKRQLFQSIIESQHNLPKALSTPLAKIRFRILGILPRSFYYKCVHATAAFFNKKSCQYLDVIKNSMDHLPVSSFANAKITEFEGIKVHIPDHVEDYLRHHYPDLKSPDMIQSLWKSHAPFQLSFDTGKPVKHDSTNVSNNRS